MLAVLDPRLDGGNPTTRGNDHLAREVETSTLPSQEISHSINLFPASNFVRFLSCVPYLCLVMPSLSGGIHSCWCLVYRFTARNLNLKI